MAEIGETLVAAWYHYIGGGDLVVEGVRLPDQGELDVLSVAGRSVVAAEVATHILDLNYGGYARTVAKVTDKVLRAVAYLEKNFPDHTRRVALWSPRVPGGLVTLLGEVADLELVANEEYGRRVQQLIDHARANPSQTSNSAYRLLQILTHIRGSCRIQPMTGPG